MKKYIQISNDIEQKILDGFYPENTFLPTEHVLMTNYHVSRDTIRKALDELAKQRLIQKQRGSGSKVLSRNRIMFPISELISYTEIVNLQNLDSKTNVISISEEIITEKLAKLTGFPIDTPVIHIVRQRVVNDQATVYDIDYFNQTIIPSISREIAEHSIYDYLENQLHLPVDVAQKEITIANANATDKLLLDIGYDKHVVCVKSKSFLSNRKQFQFTESRHKLDTFRFIDFARRQK